MNFSNTLHKSTPDYNSIQVFRFVAAFTVIVCHSSFYTAERLTTGAYIYRAGANGVDLFFVISGFVMIISSENLIKVKNGWKIFAVKRIIRIVPVYWLITTFKLILLITAANLVYHSRFDLGLTLKSYLFIPALNIDGEYRPLYGVGWTLNLEMFFYLFFTISLALKIKPIPFLTLLFVPLAILSFYKKNSWPDISFYCDPIVLNFLYGMFAAKLILRGYRLPAAMAVVIILWGLLFMFIPRVGILQGFDEPDKISLGIVAFLIIYSGVSIDGMIKKDISAWLLYLGGASYSLYLVHPTVAPFIPTVLHQLGIGNPCLSILLSVLFAGIAGVVFYRYCENPITQFLKKKMKKLNK